MTFKPAFRNIFKIMDYLQNIYPPNFEAGQPGDTYDWPPLHLYQFGIVDVLTGNYVLHSYIYIEAVYKEGVNNVVLCLITNNKEMGYFSGSKFWEINIFLIPVRDKTRTRCLCDIFSVNYRNEYFIV